MPWEENFTSDGSSCSWVPQKSMSDVKIYDWLIYASWWNNCLVKLTCCISTVECSQSWTNMQTRTQAWTNTARCIRKLLHSRSTKKIPHTPETCIPKKHNTEVTSTRTRWDSVSNGTLMRLCPLQSITNKECTKTLKMKGRIHCAKKKNAVQNLRGKKQTVLHAALRLLVRVTIWKKISMSMQIVEIQFLQPKSLKMKGHIHCAQLRHAEEKNYVQHPENLTVYLNVL